jgi:hypothetical protein
MKKQNSAPPAPTQLRALARPLNRLIVFLALAGCAASTYAVDLVNDTWKDGNRNTPTSPIYSETGTDSDADGNIESLWRISAVSPAPTFPANPSSPGNNMLRNQWVSGEYFTTYFTSNSAVNLNNAGDELKVTWKFILTGVTNTAGNSFRMAIVDGAEAARGTSDGAPGSSTYAGYGPWMNMSGTNISQHAILYRNNPATSTALLSASGEWTSLATDTGVYASPNEMVGFVDGVEYTYVFTVAHVPGAQLSVTSTMTGGQLGNDGVSNTDGKLEVGVIDAAPRTFRFDTFSARNQSGCATNCDTTLFKVEYIPAACAPTVYTVTGSGQICAGGQGNVGLSDSDTGVDYHLYSNGTATGVVSNGTGSAIDFGPQNVAVYTVYASNTSISCQGWMTGSAVFTQYADPVVTVNPAPASAVNSVGDTRVFSITATGPGLTYRWYKDTVALNNGGNISGANTATLTLNNLTLGDSGTYDCAVTNSPCGVSVTSASATLSVLDSSGLLFRSASVGPALWSDPASWEQSTNGTDWVVAAAPPSNLDSNIVIRTGHTIQLDSEKTVDEMSVQAGGTLSMIGGNLNVNNRPGVDLAVAGTLEVSVGGGSIIPGVATIEFASGSVFNWNNSVIPAIPAATWLDGSTCRISQMGGASALATGMSGQSFYDFIYDTTTAGQGGVRCRLDIQGTATQIRRDLTVIIPDVASASVSLLNATNALLTVGRHVTFQTGTNSGNANKVLLANAALPGLGIKIGGNLTATGYLDGFGNASTLVEFNGTSQTVSLPSPVWTNIITAAAIKLQVNSGSTVNLAAGIHGDGTGYAAFTNNGTLNLNGNTISNIDALVFNGPAVVNATGTNKFATAIDSFTAGGTLNLGALPAFAGGESFQLIQSVAYNGSFGTLLPTVPDGTHTWVTTQLNSAGILAVSGGTPAATNITFTTIGGNQVVLNWPAGQGWKLQAQTNTLAVGLSSNWAEVPGATPPYTNTVSPANQATFYRLVFP